MNKSRESQVDVLETPVLHKPAVIKQVLDQPQVTSIIEKKNVEIRTQPVVTLIKEQPIIEIQKALVTQHVQKDDIVHHQRVPTQYEDIQPEVEEQPFHVEAPETKYFKKYADVKHVKLGSDIQQIVEREVIERHVIPTITEVREQKIINVVDQPIVRTYYKKPIVREIRTGQLEMPILQDGLVRELPFDLEKPSATDLLNTKENLNVAKPLAQPEFKEELMSAKMDNFNEIKKANFVPPVEDLVEVKEALNVAKPLAQSEFKEELKEGKDILRPVSLPYVDQSIKEPAFVPPVEELLEVKDSLKSAKPLSNPEFKQEISLLKEPLVDSSVYSQQQSGLPSTHVLAQKNLIAKQDGALATEEFKDELQRGKSLLHDSRPFANEHFKEELNTVTLEHNTNPLATEEFREAIQYGQEVLHDARPLSREEFVDELKTQKLSLKKTNYFSKDGFLPEFMSHKVLLKSNPSSLYSRELASIDSRWKEQHLSVVEKAKNVVGDAVEAVKETLASTKNLLGL